MDEENVLNEHEFEFSDFVRIIMAAFVATVVTLFDTFSYGLVVFPSQILSQKMYKVSVVDGIYMFLLSSIVSQLTLTCLSSFESGVVGGMMIENIPFMNAMAEYVYLNAASDEAVIPTIMAAYSINTALIGIAFWCLALIKRQKMASLMSFIPPFFLNGLLASIGLYLIQIAISIGTCKSIKTTFMVLVGAISFAAYLLFSAMGNSISASNPYSIPASCAGAIGSFYAVYWLLFSGTYSLDDLREIGLLFDFKVDSRQTLNLRNVFGFWRLFDLQKIDWECLFGLKGSLISSVIFGIFHFPINVPSYAAAVTQTFSSNRYIENQISSSTNEKFSPQAELRNHAISNLAAAVLGALPNYMIFSSSVLFFKAGGHDRISNVILLAGMLIALVFGVALLRYTPKAFIVGLILFMGADLVRVAGLGAVAGKTSTDKIERLTVLTMMISGVFVSFSVAMLLGLFLSLIKVAAVAGRIQVCQKVASPNCRAFYSQRTAKKLRESFEKNVVWIGINGSLFWFDIKNLLEGFNEILNRDTLTENSWIVIDVRDAQYLPRHAFDCALEICNRFRCAVLGNLDQIKVLSECATNNTFYFSSDVDCNRFLAEKLLSEYNDENLDDLVKILKGDYH